MEKRRVDNKGFSLIELIVAVIIIAIISGGSIMAFGSVFSNKITASCEALQDGLKQARVDALGMENKNITANKTGIYAKFYHKDSAIYIDVCSKNSDSETEAVLHTRKICDDSHSLMFYVNYNDATAIKTIDESYNDTYGVRIYFKKSTGGVAGVEFGSSVTKEKVDCIKIMGPSGETKEVVLVKITGRSYLG